MKRLAIYTVIAIATLTLLLLAWEFRYVLILFILSLLTAATVRPVIARLVRYGLPMPVAMILTYISGLGLIAFLIYTVGDLLLDELQVIANKLAFTYETSHPRWLQGTDLERALAARLPPPTQVYESITGREGELLAQTLFGVTQSILAVVGGMVMVLVLSVYWSSDQDHFERLWLSLLPAGQRARARNVWRDIEISVGDYLRSELIQSFLAAILLGLGFWLLRLHYPILLALLGAVAWLIPLVGAVLIAVPVFLVGLSISLPLALTATVYTLVVLLVLNFVVEPRIFNQRHYNSLLIVLMMVPLVDAFGIAGLLVAPPLAAAAQLLLTHLFGRINGRTESTLMATKATTGQIKTLEERLATLQAMFWEREEPPPHEIVSMVERLSDLLERARQVVPAEETATATASASASIHAGSSGH